MEGIPDLYAMPPDLRNPWSVSPKVRRAAPAKAAKVGAGRTEYVREGCASTPSPITFTRAGGMPSSPNGSRTAGQLRPQEPVRHPGQSAVHHR
ncbi:MAG: hypothetical protein R3F11_09110 [Verrucomicrobiales bacterium]